MGLKPDERLERFSQTCDKSVETHFVIDNFLGVYNGVVVLAILEYGEELSSHF